MPAAAMEEEESNLGPATEIAVRNRASLKPEHRELLDVLLADPGMAERTREGLVSHLLEEEDPRLLRELARAKSTSTGMAPPQSGGLTVGSLRANRPGRSATRGTVGPLNR
jgi:hypothetical protein